VAEKPTTVIAAFLANLAIAIAKFVAFSFTGSSSLLAEGFHSVADTGNQVLLLLGRHRAGKAASEEHPFGYAPERYFWAFVVSMVLFSLGALLSFFEAYEKYTNPHPIESPIWAFAVLGVAILAESIGLSLAVREANHERRGSWWRYIRSTKDAETSVVLLEDTAAEIGLTVAIFGVSMAVVTGDGRWDALGSFVIGLILAFVSGLLATEMRSLLVGEAARREDREAIREAIREEPRLERLLELRTMHLGPEELMVTARIELDAALSFDEAAGVIGDIEHRIRRRLPIAKQIYLEPSLGSGPDA
jgi:cation diffusion facilitator family transporter